MSFPDYATPIGAELHRALHGERDYGPGRDPDADDREPLRVEARDPRGAWPKGQVVVADRYLASSVAYGEAQGLDPDWLFEAQSYLPQPALTVMIDIAPATAVARKRANRDRFEQDLAMLERVRVSYRRQAAAPGLGGHRRRAGRRTSVAADVATARLDSARAAGRQSELTMRDRF